MNLRKTLTRVNLLLLAGIFLSGCVSMSSMQTARVTEPGEVAMGFGGGYVKTEINFGAEESTTIAAPYLELNGRFGITERLDVGARLGLIGTAGVDAKYQFLGDNQSLLAASGGLGVGYVSISSGDSKSNIVDLHVPAYVSLHPTDFFSIYAVPRFVLRTNSYTTDIESGTSSSNWLGASAGIRLGRKTAFFAEYSHFGASGYDQPLGQFMLGIGINMR